MFLMDVWKNEKCYGDTSCKRVFPQLFRVLPDFHECFYYSIETPRILFLLDNIGTKEKETFFYVDHIFLELFSKMWYSQAC